MPKVAIVVEYAIAEGNDLSCTAILTEHARRTLREEPGCLRFEVIKPVDADGKPVPGTLMLVELYADEAAFAAHKANPRLPSVKQALAPLLTSNKLTVAHLLDDSPSDEGISPDELNAANDG